MRTSSGIEPALRVGDDFAREFPEADSLSTECYLNLVQLGERLLGEFGRRLKFDFDLSPSAATVLAIIEGRGGQASPNEIAERAFISSASATSVLDSLERRGLVVRLPHPGDRRKILVRLTPQSYEVLDNFLPGVHKLEKQIMKVLSPKERERLLEWVARLQSRIVELASEPAAPLRGQRNLPDRLRRGRA